MIPLDVRSFFEYILRRDSYCTLSTAGLQRSSADFFECPTYPHVFDKTSETQAIGFVYLVPIEPSNQIGVMPKWMLGTDCMNARRFRKGGDKDPGFA